MSISNERLTELSQSTTLRDMDIPFSTAETFATMAHGAQLYGDQPYASAHLRIVVENLVSFGFDSQIWVAAGWLHDSIEDTSTTFEQIENKFTKSVADLVWAVSGVGGTRKLRNASIYEKITAYPKAAILKAADRIHNVESASTLESKGLFAMYTKEREAFGEVVYRHIPVAMMERLERAYEL